MRGRIADASRVPATDARIRLPRHARRRGTRQIQRDRGRRLRQAEGCKTDSARPRPGRRPPGTGAQDRFSAAEARRCRQARSARQIQRGRGPAVPSGTERKTDSAGPRPGGAVKHGAQDRFSGAEARRCRQTRSARQIQRGGRGSAPPYPGGRARTFPPSVSRRAHSSPRHACALHRVHFLHCLQRGPAPALYGVLRASLAPVRPALPCAVGGPAWRPVASYGHLRAEPIFQVTTGTR